MTPAGFAHRVSGGKWVCPPHLDLLNRKLMGVATGEIRRLLITMPPRHGKSFLTSQFFPAWYVGTFPDRRVILTSYEADFAAEWGRKTRDILQEHGPDYFGVSVRRDSNAADRWGIVGRSGGMQTAGVGGPITGKGADLLIIDDPVKNAEEAASETYRRKTWDWYASTAYTRLEPGAALILIQTRWHADDLAGRVLERAKAVGERWEIVNFPALAEGGDVLGRAPGEALWPDRFDVAALENIRDTGGEQMFAALYQQHPVPATGGLFKVDRLEIVAAAPAEVAGRVRAWDFAATSDGDWTVGTRMARTHENLFYVEDVVRGRWTPMQRDRMVLQTARMDGREVEILLEQEPGSAGVSVVDSATRMLAGYDVHSERPTGSKPVRAQPFAAQVEAGNVHLVAGDWNHAFREELASFPFGKHDDQVDSASSGFNRLALGHRTFWGPDPTAPAHEPPKRRGSLGPTWR